HMAHMDAPRGIGEHLKNVVARARIVVLRLEDALVRPDRLPARLRFAGIVSLACHALSRGQIASRAAGGSAARPRPLPESGTVVNRKGRRPPVFGIGALRWMMLLCVSPV